MAGVHFVNLGSVRTSRRTAKTWRAELVLSAGPLQLGQTGSGTLHELYGAFWALALTANGPRLLQVQAGAWTNQSDLDALGELAAAGVRHVSLAFDQAARPVLAWEVGDVVFVRQWSPLDRRYVTRGPWPGCDPVLWWDAGGSRQVADSDVLLFHLSPDRLHLTYRMQRDLYAVASPHHVFDAPAVLDQATTLPYAVQLHGEADGQRFALVAGLYPVHVSDVARAAPIAPQAGALVSVVQTREVAPDQLSAAALPPTSGLLFAPVEIREGRDALQVMSSAPQAGALVSVVQTREVAPDQLGAAARAPQAGIYTLVVVTYTTQPDALTVGALSPTGGKYA